MREHEIQNAIKELLEFRKCIVLRQNTGKWQDSRTGSWIQGAPLGTPDLVVGVPRGDVHVLGWVEVKSPTGHLSVEQIAFLRKMHGLGCPWVVADSVQDIERWLADLFQYHGTPRHVLDVLDEGKRFIPSRPKTTKKQRLSLSTLHEFNRWADKYDV